MTCAAWPVNDRNSLCASKLRAARELIVRTCSTCDGLLNNVTKPLLSAVANRRLECDLLEWSGRAQRMMQRARR